MPEIPTHSAGPLEATDTEHISNPLSLPGYELLAEIGHGGMGVVYRARDAALDRDVAVKLLAERYPANSPAVQRFLSEARITGQLQHPSIPAVHQVGTLVGGLTVVLAVQRRANADLASKNRELADERAKVEARFELAAKAIALFHSGFSEDMLLKNAEFEGLRTKLLKEAAGFYAELEKLLAGQTDAKSRQALAAAYFQLGELTDKIGDKKEALAVHRKALALRRELAAGEGADGETRLEVARNLGGWADC